MAIIISGASKGIGRALAFTFASHGHDVAICARNVHDLEAVANEIALQNPDVEVLYSSVDVSKPEEIKTFTELVFQSYETIECLINNAGIFVQGKLLEEPEGSLQMQMETNVYSAYHFSRLCLPKLKSQQYGHIFNICSIASLIPYTSGSSYSVTKFAMLGFSKVLREECKELGIKVTAVLPGATWTDAWKGVDLPEDRLMNVDDIATTVYSAFSLSKTAVVEEIIIRPQLGDL